MAGVTINWSVRVEWIITIIGVAILSASANVTSTENSMTTGRSTQIKMLYNYIYIRIIDHT